MHTTHCLHIYGLALLLASTLTYGMEPTNKMNLRFITHPITQEIASIEAGEATLFDHVHQTIKDEIVARRERKRIRELNFETQFLGINYDCYQHIGTPSLYEIESGAHASSFEEIEHVQHMRTDLDISAFAIEESTDRALARIDRTRQEEDICRRSVHDALMNDFTAIEALDDGIQRLRQKQSLNTLSQAGEVNLRRYQSQMNFIAQQYLPLVSHAVTFYALKTNANHVASLGIQKNKPHNNRVRKIQAKTSTPVKKR